MVTTTTNHFQGTFCCSEKVSTLEDSTPMGGFHRASTGKDKKVLEISPLLAFWPKRAKE